MHEVSVATELYRACRAELGDRCGAGGGRLTAVAVDVGELSAVEPPLLAYAWEAITAGGPDAGAALEVRWCPARQTCPACGPIVERQPGSWLRLCPSCSAPLVVEGGQELEIRSITYDTAAAAARELTT